jgi:hypothetical protein
MNYSAMAVSMSLSREQRDGMEKRDGVMFADGAFCILLGQFTVTVGAFGFRVVSFAISYRENPDVSDFEYNPKSPSMTA